MKTAGEASEESGVGLLERDAEISALDRMISEPGGPGPRLGLIEGPAGIGKTSLLVEARRHLEAARARILTARGSELEREYSYGVVRQLFEPALLEPDVRERALAGPAAPAEGVFAHPDGTRSPTGDSGFSTLHGLYWLTLEIAGEKPLAIIVDDLHWGDSSSLRFLAYLVRRLEGTSITVLAATRPDEPGADMRLIGEIASDPLAITVRPGPLSADAVAALVEARLGVAPERAFSDACRRATGGNPLLLGELLTALAAEGVKPLATETKSVHDIGPRAVSRAVLLRLGRLSPDARATARVLAVAGEEAELWLLSALAGLDERRVAAATGELQQAGILASGNGLRFAHPLVHAAVLGDIAPGERELNHAEAARRLRETGAPAERIASHLLAIPPRSQPWVAETLREAARGASARGAAENAAAYLARAIAEPPRAEERKDYVVELGLAQAITDLPASVPTLREAYESSTDPVARARLANVLARAVLFMGEPAAAAAVALEAAESLPPELEDTRLGLLAFDSAAAFFGTGSTEAFERLTRWRDVQRVETLGEKAMAAVVAFDWANRNGPLEDCVTLALAALAGGELIEADNGLLPMYAIGTLWLADRDEVMDSWRQMQAIAHRAGSLFGISTVQLWHGYTHLFRGDLSAAESLLREALESFRLFGYRLGSREEGLTDAYVASILGQVLIARGEVGQARALFEQSADPGPEDSARYWLTTKYELAMEEGRAEDAVDVAEELGQRLSWNLNPTNAPWRTMKAEALARLDRREEAVELAEEELEVARGWGAPAAVGHSLRVLGTLRGEAGIAQLEEAVAELERSTRRLELALALCAHGVALRLARKPTEARDPLRRAIELAEACGAAPLLKRARAELAATGARPRSTALSGVESLTPSERRVADLAAAGMSNREIAQELYVTPKTVEVHLSNSYRKLEIRGRRELPQALAPDS